MDADFRFAASVAAFGMQLRDSEFKGQIDYNLVLSLGPSRPGRRPGRPPGRIRPAGQGRPGPGPPVTARAGGRAGRKAARPFVFSSEIGPGRRLKARSRTTEGRAA